MAASEGVTPASRFARTSSRTKPSHPAPHGAREVPGPPVRLRACEWPCLRGCARGAGLARLARGGWWKLDRLARSLKQLIETVELLSCREVGLRSFTESIDTTTAGGKLVFHVFGALAEFERSIIHERTKAGLEAARARGPDRQPAACPCRQEPRGGQGPAVGPGDHRGRGGQAAQGRPINPLPTPAGRARGAHGRGAVMNIARLEKRDAANGPKG
jgi:hypothetical protein